MTICEAQSCAGQAECAPATRPLIASLVTGRAGNRRKGNEDALGLSSSQSIHRESSAGLVRRQSATMVEDDPEAFPTPGWPYWRYSLTACKSAENGAVEHMAHARRVFTTQANMDGIWGK